ncbi:hypothetical protein [Vibrio chaetopteri]|uniref:Uncharacterized protein n=1 Tax=Vibrio chaetopteri TaxID=3016528 RepID=A0AAU8BTF0_9VIBR
MFKGYQILREALTDRELDSIMRYLAIMKNMGALKGNADGHSAHMYYSIPYFEALLSSFALTVSEAVGEEVYPCYSFLWNYKKGHEVPKHRDRDAVDYIVSFNINNKGEDDWPIYIEGERVDLRNKEALILDGKALVHWREACPYPNRLQLVLCYTRRKCFRFDKRQHLGFDPMPEVVTAPFTLNLSIDDTVITEMANDEV